MTVTKQKLTDLLADSPGLTGRDCKVLVEALFGTIRATLATGEAGKLSGFGNFTLREKSPRPGCTRKNACASAVKSIQAPIRRSGSPN
ncbi:HU family DNA-binding protein [Acidithiobacillus thiooxidans]|uniref:HU family DNA-binding protein n=1 Tax=Acidithiobacillus thiooxidans TaxID=930 RepID=UPI0011516973|nr:HU family DNA-binding protein [Acidithiobacillus thiooxidans]MDX5936404.1 HU family DNA-binding protein [Acidithiobacillus thiooxidans]